MDKNDFMRLALLEAEKAFLDGEVPVGAVVTRNGEIVSVGRNRREKDKNALAHAEIEAIDRACKALGGWQKSRRLTVPAVRFRAGDFRDVKCMSHLSRAPCAPVRL